MTLRKNALRDETKEASLPAHYTEEELQALAERIGAKCADKLRSLAGSLRVGDTLNFHFTIDINRLED